MSNIPKFDKRNADDIMKQVKELASQYTPEWNMDENSDDFGVVFSKVYSNYIISKTYDEGVVAEDKVWVILNILLSKIAKDMIDGNFKNKYLYTFKGLKSRDFF